MKVAAFVPAETLSTFKVGGTVRRVVDIEAVEEVAEVLQTAELFGDPVVLLGHGSNVLFPDGELAATIVRYTPQKIFIDGVDLVAEAGASWDEAVAQAVVANLWGIENLSAIPGTAGGAVVQNIGAYGAALSETLVSVRAYDRVERRVVLFHVSECRFGYRTSVFKQSRDRFLILDLRIRLSRSGTPNISYKDLTQYGLTHTAALSDIRAAVGSIRSRKFPPLYKFGTAGSYFLNPVVTHEEAAHIAHEYPEMPLFVLPEGGVKVPIGWYFEHVLKIRGLREGSVEAWREQALVIVAHRGATATEVKNFTNKIVQRAERELAITLTSEVREL